ncbi:hypothetical protein LTR36_003181 [Oleoguttula mirabilis]|uniref:Uncharacterized protein n=1 Tax=Oleoguttula mirabilis TaxID=1507867 RepID=A0AAV9JX42_9PEZI|nr:hypothetical protein LTR36_003181 [Oleoguttula mirabilis]
MAETYSKEAASSSQVTGRSSGANGGLAGNHHSSASSTRQPQEAPTMSFQAINARAVSDNAARYTPPTAHAASSAQSRGSPAVAPGASQTAQSFSNHQPPPPQYDGMDGVMTDPATYGTRSRNRTGNARPNYAEDQDMDFDHSSAGTTKKKASGGGLTPVPQPQEEAKRADDFARFTAVNNNLAGKELTPGSAVPAASSSKKRKATSNLPQQAQPSSASTTPAPVALRKPPTSTSSTLARETNVMTFTRHRSSLNKKGELVADDGTKLAVNDHVYLVCEPPGEPYYLCRIMEFLHVDSANPNSPIDSMRVNWYYRPRDVQRFNSDTRLAYGTMHSDMCPLTSLRGKCTIKHRSEIEDLDAYRKERDSFYFVQVFDRFIKRWYECIPVSQIINVPDKVKKALDERWKFVVVEIGRVKELTSAVKTCKRCARFAATNDSVDCAICKNSYHMNCVQPPLPKKPSRGFAWACGPCSRASERKLEARNTPTTGDVTEAEDEPVEEEQQPAASNDSTRAPSPSGEDIMTDKHPATQAEVALAKMWPMRYLGIHCRVEDALQYDDRAIYPRASSRLGPRHQANVNMWHGRAVELVKPAEIKKRYNKSSSSHKKDGKLTKETIAALEADRDEKAKRPKWVQDEPPGYVPRGEDYPQDDPRCTAKLLFKMPERGDPGGKAAFVDDYVKRAKQFSRAIGVPPFGVNFLDKALELLTANNYNVDVALRKLQQVDRKRDLREPVLTKADLTKFEEGVAKYGSEHRLIRLHMKTTLPNSDIVRFYYLWKKTPKGREIWGNYGGRKGSKRKVESEAGARIQAEVAHDGDDSAFDNDKAARRNRSFQCKFCNTAHSRQWRKAPFVSAGQTAPGDGKGGSKDTKEKPLLALCLRCAGLWRKYAIQWEDIDEVAKKVAHGGGRALKRRIDEELLRELVAANEAASMPAEEPPAAIPSIEAIGEPPKKKSKFEPAAAVVPPEPPKKKEKPPPPPREPTPPPPPIIPNQPTWKVLPCAICRVFEDTVACAHCKLTVHRRCFGVAETDGVRADGSLHWICEQCSNDRHPEVSTDYACCLCVTEETLVDLVEPPKVSHKKKTDREREKERMEKELADTMRSEYRNKQVALNRSLLPREPLKKTTGNNWVHVHCAVWTPEIRFSNAHKMEVAEGFQLIPPAKYEAVCKLCKNKDHTNKVREDAGACVSCLQCNANFHASCAFEAGYQFGFDVTPVKGSRKDQITTAKLGEETGLLTAAIWCKEHVVKSIVHPLNEIVDETGKLALQVFVENYKQADLTLTGTVRKANIAQLTKDKGLQAATAVTNGTRRESTANSIAAAVRRGARTSSAAEAKAEAEEGATKISEVPEAPSERRCVKCKFDATPRWHPVVKEPPPKEPTPPLPRRMSMTLGEIADLERQRSQAASRVNGGADTTGAPVDRSAPAESSRTQQNIRFMAPGASGRAWDGMTERFANRLTVNGEAAPSEQSPAVVPSREPVSETNGEPQSLGEESRSEDVFHNHALPRYQNPAATPPPAQEEPVVANVAQDYLCHKCFIKKKIDPTPSPPPRPAPVALSPPRQFPIQLDWNRPPGPPPSQPPPSGRIRMPWDDPPRQSQPPPLHQNGVGPTPPTFGSHSASQGSGYPPYGSQPNGYHAPPPHHAPPPAPPRMHDRQPSFGYGPPPPASNPPPYAPHSAARPSPIPAFPPPSQPMANGIHSPQNGHPQLQSPAYAPGPQQHHQPYPPRRTESPFTSHLPPIGQPLHSGSPQITFGRPEPINGHAANGQAATPGPQHTSPQLAFPRPDLLNRQPSTPAPGFVQQNASPQVAQARPEGQTGNRPTTPREGQTNGTNGPGGASASPNLRNLLH